MQVADKKILFVTPPYHCGVVEVAGSWPPLGLLYLAAQAEKAGWNAKIYDAMTLQHNHKDIKRCLGSLDFDVFATTSITPTFPDSQEICRTAKTVNPGCTTIIGGVHPSFCHEEIFAAPDNTIDYVFTGEGEISLHQFLSAYDNQEKRQGISGLVFKHDGKLQSNPPPSFNDDLDSLPVAWHLLDWNLYKYYVLPGSTLGAVSTSRGCIHGCTFCSQQRFWNKIWRGRQPEWVVAEIETVHKLYGINVFLFTDEYPTYDRDRWEEILDRLISKSLDIYILIETRVEDIIRDADILSRYRRAGIIHVYVGAEATDQAALDRMNKGITVMDSQRAIRLLAEYGMISETSFVLGFPEETSESIERTLKLAMTYNPDFAHFLAITPWPYADFYDEVSQSIIINDYRKYNLIEPVIKPDGMSLKEVDRAIINCYRRFYIPKMAEIVKLHDQFKRNYMLTSLKLIMKSSFLKEKFARLGLKPSAIMGGVLRRLSA